MADGDTQFKLGGHFDVDTSAATVITVDEVRKRREAFMPDGTHAWVIHVIHALDDPETALDDMVLDAESFVGITQIHCLLCHTEYRSEIRYYKCPQVRPESRGGDVTGNS